MNALDVLCAKLTRDLFAIAKFLLTTARLLLHCWYSLGRPVTTGTPMVIFVLFWLCFDCFFDDWYTVGTVLVDMWRLVHQWSFLLFWLSFDCFWRLVHRWYTVGTVLVDLWRFVHQWFWVFLTIGTVYHSSKTVKNSQTTVKTAKITICIPIVTCLHRVRRIHKSAQTPLPCKTSTLSFTYWWCLQLV